ncbi:hypothetical protein [Oscillibacter sp.]|uniref:hypothetical protein n=1 Tax=Oscillibacter sp. TaxID=1945593 RepID=UPI0028A6C29D|nr:hypothetical protein [Oscillibacter sp.]
MDRQTEAFRKMHPEQFSDSKIIQRGKLDRDFLDFYFETLTSKSLDKAFEDFCRHIAEVEICPNLLPQTGPTGGGDSKVDSETYPVAETISTLWYYGDGNKAATERWAFAISAKKDWKPKVKSDILKIAKVNEEENRGYIKIFFMSNQYISDKKRADTEDELRKLYNLDVRIIDRTWLLDKALKNTDNVMITIKSFDLSDNFCDEVQVGENDYRRKQEYDEIQNLIGNNAIKPSEMIALSQQSIVLARELEFSKQLILGLIDRNNRIAKEHGNILDIANSVYDAAWTIYWWYPDVQLYYQYYKEYEEIVLSENNVHLFSNLVTLWINLFSLSHENTNAIIDDHTAHLQEKYNYFISDPSKPNTAIEAKAAYQLIRFFLGDTLNDIVDEMIQIMDDSFGHLDLDLYPLSRVVQEFPVFEKADRYNELFERIVTIMSKQKQKSEAALMLAKRGHSLKEKKPYEAMTYFSRSLMGLYSENNKSHLITVIMEMGDIFESVGLLWAARNFYYYDFCLCLNQYMKFGKVLPILFISAHALKFIELRLGHILYATSFDVLSKISEHLYPDEINSNNNTDNADNFDYVLAIQILRTNYETEKFLGQLPSYLESYGFTFSSAAMKYELGYYDEDILTALNGSTEAFDDLIGKWKSQPALDHLNFLPWYGIEPSCCMTTNLLGCSIELNTNGPYEHGEVEIGATILATIESFFGTGVANELISLTGKIRIDLCYDADCESLIKGKILDDKPNVISVIFKDYDSKNIVAAQSEFSDFLLEIIGMVVAIMFPFSSELRKIERMVKNDAAFDRSQTFSNSVFYGMETLGRNTFSFESVIHDFEDLPMKRVVKAQITNEKLCEDKIEPIIPETVHYCKPPDVDLKNISNTDIFTSSIINVPLWNICGWKGVLFMANPLHAFPPVISLAFTKPTCKSIFEDWIKDIGHNDSKNEIGIRIIKGIDKRHPYWYRVIIGQLGFLHNRTKDSQIIAMPVRFHTMEPNNDVNLKMFERELHIVKKFSICPSYFLDIAAQPQVFEDLMIYKNLESIIICDACDVQENDWLTECGILPTDDPIIPFGKENAPILTMIERKKHKENNSDYKASNSVY